MAIHFRGSSPLTRGKPIIAAASDAARRLIPAHAGKTTRMCTLSATSSAHPRSRGENCGGVPRSHTCGGSSPLTRGKQVDLRPQVEEAGLIPAHAGKTT